MGWGMYIVLGVICIVFGAFMTAKPEAFLRFRDHHRIEGERKYTDVAIFFKRLEGITVIISGIALIVIHFLI